MNFVLINIIWWYFRAGLPDGVFNIVHGLGSEVGASIVGHPDVAAISFTGGTATGRLVAAQAAPHFKKVSLELGGKNPAIILPDADLGKIFSSLISYNFIFIYLFMDLFNRFYC